MVYRSWVRLCLWTPLALALIVGCIGAVIVDGDPAPVILVLTGFVVLAFTWWPKLTISSAGLVVRNLRSHSIAWSDLKGTRVDRQLPHMHRWWRRLSEVHETDSIGRTGQPGLLLRTERGVVPVIALQQSVIGPSGRGAAFRAAEELTEARRAARRGDDPVAAVRAVRAGR